MKAFDGFHMESKGIGVSPAIMTVVAVAATLVVVIAWSKAEKPTIQALSPPAGAPCPAVSQDAISWRPEPRLKSAVGGVVFARGAGDVRCDVEGSPMAEASDHGDTVLCQFSAPMALSVRTGRAEFAYEAPAGQVASVYVSHGKPRCVLAAPYWAALSRSLTDDMHARPS